jgi:hypothetical protein
MLLLSLLVSSCGSGAAPSASDIKSDAQRRIDALNSRKDIPAQVRETLINRIRANAHVETTSVQVPGRKGGGSG